jgi:CheY-like chemotaxis protein
MVVDDDAVTRHMLQDTCLAVHAHVDCCAMASAIEALLHLPVFKPHIMFLDLLMPQVDGWEMVRRVKQNENFAQMQIITYSALNQEELQERGGPPKDANFMAKPLDLGWLRGYLLGKMSPQTWT